MLPPLHSTAVCARANVTNPFVRFVCDQDDHVLAALPDLQRYTFCIKLLCRALRDRFPSRTYTSPLDYLTTDERTAWAEDHGCVFYDSSLYEPVIQDEKLVERLWDHGCIVTPHVVCKAVDAGAVDTLLLLASVDAIHSKWIYPLVYVCGRTEYAYLAGLDYFFDETTPAGAEVEDSGADSDLVQQWTHDEAQYNAIRRALDERGVPRCIVECTIRHCPLHFIPLSKLTGRLDYVLKARRADILIRLSREDNRVRTPHGLTGAYRIPFAAMVDETSRPMLCDSDLCPLVEDLSLQDVLVANNGFLAQRSLESLAVDDQGWEIAIATCASGSVDFFRFVYARVPRRMHDYWNVDTRFLFDHISSYMMSTGDVDVPFMDGVLSWYAPKDDEWDGLLERALIHNRIRLHEHLRSRCGVVDHAAHLRHCMLSAARSAAVLTMHYLHRGVAAVALSPEVVSNAKKGGAAPMLYIYDNAELSATPSRRMADRRKLKIEANARFVGHEPDMLGLCRAFGYRG